MRKLIALVMGLVLCSLAASAHAGGARQLLGLYDCDACHSMEKRVVGPSYRKIAERYRSDKGARATLFVSIRDGSFSSKWGSIPMPPNPKFDPDTGKRGPSDKEIEAMVNWLLSL